MYFLLLENALSEGLLLTIVTLTSRVTEDIRLSVIKGTFCYVKTTEAFLVLHSCKMQMLQCLYVTVWTTCLL